MQWLTALLAFATTMLIFAIVVSTLVETIHRIWGLRSQGMRLMLENLFTRVVEPKLGGDAKVTAPEFATLIMENRAANPTAGARRPGRLGRLLRWFVDASVMTDIPVEVFTQKLADNRIVGAMDKLTDDVVKEIALNYETFGEEVSTFFERRARLFSVCVAIVVAWLFYIHPYNLAVAYLENPDVAETVAGRASDTYAALDRLQEKLAGLEAKTEDAGTQDSEELRAAIDAMKTDIAAAKDQTEKLEGMGVPIGWPVSDGLGECTLGAVVTGCVTKIFGQTLIFPSVLDAVWLLFGGLLVGLGSPFWAQAVSSLTATRDVTRKITEIVAPASTRLEPMLGAEMAPLAEPTALATFKTALKGMPEPE
jgi:hypothetical protein